MVEEKIRANFGDYLAHAEVAIYSILAVLLFITALATVANAGKMLWDGVGHWTIAAETLRVLDQLLVVLMLVEILHTVRISIRSHVLVTAPEQRHGLEYHGISIPGIKSNNGRRTLRSQEHKANASRASPTMGALL
jgi:hypothetical protein